MSGLPKRIAASTVFLLAGFPSAAFALGSTECGNYLKLLGCRVSHMSPSQRARAERGVKDSIKNLKQKMRISTGAGRKKLAKKCAQQIFEFKKAFGHLGWFARCLLAVRPCPAGTLVRSGMHQGKKTQWCQRRRGKGERGFHGPVTVWHPNGKLAAEGSYRKGKRDGQWVWYFSIDTIKEREGGFRRGKKHGTWTEYSSDGRESSNFEFRKGRKHGKCTRYRPDGRLEYIGEYRGGKKHGFWMYWNAQGRKTMSVVWSRNRKVEAFFYNRKGISVRTCRYRGRKKFCRRL